MITSRLGRETLAEAPSRGVVEIIAELAASEAVFRK
jgi:hypothetical protein